MGFPAIVGSGHAGIFQRRGKARFSIGEIVGLAATADDCSQKKLASDCGKSVSKSHSGSGGSYFFTIS